LFAIALLLFLTDKEKLDFTSMPRYDMGGGFLCAVWAIITVSMLLRLIPNTRTDIGARKHYACSYREASAPADIPAAKNRLHKGALASALAWIAFNAVIFYALFSLSLLSPAAAIVLMLFYAVCDLICVLIFCPFQVFFMRNRCCVTCRIYNWDYIMMCTPMILFPCAYSSSLLILSIAVLLFWEVSLRNNPHFFMAETNRNLTCDCCEDKLCILRNNHEGETI